MSIHNTLSDWSSRLQTAEAYLELLRHVQGREQNIYYKEYADQLKS